jgi:hypothetical protein
MPDARGLAGAFIRPNLRATQQAAETMVFLCTIPSCGLRGRRHPV